MNIGQLANIAEITGVSLVIASLIYVAKQLRQATDALHAQSRQAVLASSQAALGTVIHYPDVIKSITQAEVLTPDQHVRLHAFMISIFRAREYTWLQYQNGTVDKAQWDTELAVIRVLLSADRTREWWDKLGRTGHDSVFAEFIDEVIRDNPTTDYFEIQQRWTLSSELENGE